jgi:hypothetical protein
MLFFEYLLLAIVVGTVGGVGWRLIEAYNEKRENQALEEAALEELKKP